MNVVVTGSNGYLGGHVLDLLERGGHRVEAYDSHGYLFTKHVPTWDAIVHLAWYSSAGDGHPDIQARCLEQTRTLINQVKLAHGKPKLIFPSTLSVYGGESPTSTVLWPQCAYTRAKAQAETEIRGALGNQSLIFRFGSLMGLGKTRTKTDLVVNAFSVDGYTKGRIEVWSPEAYKPFLHVRDAAELIVNGVENREWVGVENACKNSYKAKDIANIVREVTKATVHIIPDQNGARLRSCNAKPSIPEKYLPRNGWRSLTGAILEFRGFQPSPKDRNDPKRFERSEDLTG